MKDLIPNTRCWEGGRGGGKETAIIHESPSPVGAHLSRRYLLHNLSERAKVGAACSAVWGKCYEYIYRSVITAQINIEGSVVRVKLSRAFCLAFLAVFH